MKKLSAVLLFISAIVGAAFIMPYAPVLACDHACGLDVCRPPLFPQEGWWRNIQYNNAETVGHHRDYNKPYDVTWMCHPCRPLTSLMHRDVVIEVVRMAHAAGQADRDVHAAKARLEEANWWYHKYCWPLEPTRQSSVVEGIDRCAALEQAADRKPQETR